MSRSRFVLLAVIVTIVVVFVVVIQTSSSVQATPETQITLGEERVPTIKSVELGATVGNCDLYVVVVDIQYQPDLVEIETICGEDRTAS